MIEVNGKPAIRITGFFVKSKITPVAVLVNCDGDELWFPKSVVRDNHNNSVDIQEWIYKQKFPNG
jgi:hypothetical protein